MSGVVVPPDVDRIRGCLAEVIDPCSAATGVRLSVLDMGLVRSVEVLGDQVTVSLRLTSPMCTMAPYFIREVEERIAELPGVRTVRCETDLGLAWQPDMMTPAAVRRLADNRRTPNQCRARDFAKPPG